MEDYASEAQLINLSPTRRQQTEQKVTNRKQSLLRAQVGQMDWLAQLGGSRKGGVRGVKRRFFLYTWPGTENAIGLRSLRLNRRK